MEKEICKFTSENGVVALIKNFNRYYITIKPDENSSVCSKIPLGRGRVSSVKYFNQICKSLINGTKISSK